MEVMTSYFYQIRFFKPYMIPLSTAVWDPKWFHQNKGHYFQFKDKNGVWNGLRADPFVPGSTCQNLCRGPEVCNTKDPRTCPFLQKYREQLDQLDISNILHRISSIGQQVKDIEQFDEDPIVVFIVHEAYNNPCSERWAIQDYFKAHNIKCTEFDKNTSLQN